MPDFFQTGIVSTLHRFHAHDAERFERELSQTSSKPVTLLLPCLASDFRAPAMTAILRELEQVRYLTRVILVLGSATQSDYAAVHSALERLQAPFQILWLESTRVKRLLTRLAEHGLSPGKGGKGRAVWMGFGLACADGSEGVIALHDCDITTYDRSLVDRIAYPVASPNLGYEYAKGYYARISHRMNGRAARLFVTPLVRSLKAHIGPHPFLQFIDSFRYPLSGEFALTTSLARLVRIPGDWGLEVGFLAEIHRLCAPSRVCDVELLDRFYDHKHQAVSTPEGTGGLEHMVREIARCIFRTLAIESVPLTDGLFRSLRVSYLRLAQDYIRRYADDAAIDSIEYDRHAEGTAVDLFAAALAKAIDDFRADPLASSHISNWNRVVSAIPTILEELQQAVASDAAQFGKSRPRREGPGADSRTSPRASRAD